MSSAEEPNSSFDIFHPLQNEKFRKALIIGGCVLAAITGGQVAADVQLLEQGVPLKPSGNPVEWVAAPIAGVIVDVEQLILG